MALLSMTALVGLLALLTPLAADGFFYPLGGWPAELGIGLRADGLNLWLLWLGAAVNGAVGLYAWRYFAPRHYFYPLWLLLWAAYNGALLSADLFNIYVNLELLGLAAVCLAALDGKSDARRAALRYLLLNLFGSLTFLLGVVLIYRQHGSLGLAIFQQPGLDDPLMKLSLALLGLGLIIKSALFPLHGWLPPAHAQATAPASALLSALVIKVSLYLQLRIWLPAAADGDIFAILFQFFGLLGAAAIFWGSLQALRCASLKELIAYSSVAQMGYFFLAFPLFTGPTPEIAILGLLFLLAAHALAKAAFFLAAGTTAKAGDGSLPHGRLAIADLAGLSRRRPLTAITMALSVVSLMGMPPSGGFVGKWYLLQAAMAGAQWWLVAVLLSGSLLGVAYLLRPVAATFTRRETAISAGPVESRTVLWALELPPLALALAAILLGLFPGVAAWSIPGGGLAGPDGLGPAGRRTMNRSSKPADHQRLAAGGHPLSSFIVGIIIFFLREESVGWRTALNLGAAPG
ncbi:MAG: proton-conducting transporter membrane subunit [Desulfurivibrio sp.]|nr:proton-conducting transporter membrane subunit [Desulfurivibrio sp.]